MAETAATPNVPARRQRALQALRSLFTPLLPDDYLELVNPLWTTQGAARADRANRAARVARRPRY